MCVSLLSPVGLLIHTSTVSPLVTIVRGVPFITVIGRFVFTMFTSLSFVVWGLFPTNTTLG